MAILLTNGDYYIAHNQTGAVIKVTDKSQAQDFFTVEKAIKQINKTPGKCRSFYWIDTEAPETEEINQRMQQATFIKIKRKHFSDAQRQELYKRADGCCQLCGRRITINNFTVDHIIPLGRGGNNSMSNVQAVCQVCNQFKANIYPEQFVDRITEIFMFQMEKQYRDNNTWKMARNMLIEIL